MFLFFSLLKANSASLSCVRKILVRLKTLSAACTTKSPNEKFRNKLLRKKYLCERREGEEGRAISFSFAGAIAIEHWLRCLQNDAAHEFIYTIAERIGRECLIKKFRFLVSRAIVQRTKYNGILNSTENFVWQFLFSSWQSAINSIEHSPIAANNN